MGLDLTEISKKRLYFWVSQPRKTFTYVWFISLLLVLITFIVSCIAASRLKNAGGAGAAAGFAAVWTCLLLILISVIGTHTMRKFSSRLALGFFLGMVFIMTNQMLIVFVIFADYAKYNTDGATVQAAERAMAAFSFFLFVMYAFVGSLLATFRNDIVPPEGKPEQEEVYEEEANEGDAENGEENAEEEDDNRN